MVAIYTINGAAGAGFEGNLSFLSAFTAFNGEELAGGGGCEGWCFFLNQPLRSFSSAGSPAGWTALGRMIVALSLESLLFFYSENIGSLAIEAD